MGNKKRESQEKVESHRRLLKSFKTLEARFNESPGGFNLKKKKKQLKKKVFISYKKRTQKKKTLANNL